MEKLPECILFALFSGKIDCTFKTMVKVCGCCDKPYILGSKEKLSKRCQSL